MPSHQSSFRKFHSTEIALLKAHNDILSNMDQQKITLLVLLHLSVGFHTIHHTVLLETLESDFGVVGNAQNWIASFLLGRKQHVVIDRVQSEGRHSLTSGVPQGSCLGPVLFLLYVSGIFKIASKYLPFAHAFADDTQLYLSFKPTPSFSQSDAIRSMEECVAEAQNWLLGHKLLINDTKTDFLIIGSRQQLAKVTINSMHVGESIITPITSVRNLGAWFDDQMSMSVHVGKVCCISYLI